MYDSLSHSCRLYFNHHHRVILYNIIRYILRNMSESSRLSDNNVWTSIGAIHFRQSVKNAHKGAFQISDCSYIKERDSCHFPNILISRYVNVSLFVNVYWVSCWLATRKNLITHFYLHSIFSRNSITHKGIILIDLIID